MGQPVAVGHKLVAETGPFKLGRFDPIHSFQSENDGPYLYSVNPATGAETRIGAFSLPYSGGPGTAVGMSTGSDTLYLTTGNYIYSLNTTTGAATFLGTFNINESGFGALVTVGHTLYGAAYDFSHIPNIYALDIDPHNVMATLIAASPSTPFFPGLRMTMCSRLCMAIFAMPT